MVMRKVVVATCSLLMLVGCSTPVTSKTSTTTSSSDEGIIQNTNSLEAPKYDLQIVGSMKGEETFPSWDPANAVERQLFTRVSNNEYTLKGINLAVDDEFKFTFDHKWSNDFGSEGVDVTNSPVAANFDIPTKANIKVKVAGVYDFKFNPLFVADPNATNKMVITAHAA